MTEPVPAPAPAPAPQPAPVASDGKTLGIVALVVTFFAALVGLILAIIARGQSKRAGVPNTPATVALVLSIILLVLGVIATIVLIIFGGALFGNLAQLCAEYGPGTHTLDNGGTITCG